MTDRDWDESGDRTAQAEIAGLKAEVKRLRWQRDKAARAAGIDISELEVACPTVQALKGGNDE